MGIGFTIDSATRVAPYGIDTVASILDDELMERLRKKFCEIHNLPYEEISINDEDCRANRTTAYLNLLNYIVKQRFNDLLNNSDFIEKYFNMLPPQSELFSRYNAFINTNPTQSAIHHWLKNNLILGHIDVNIMTKLDKINYKNGNPLPIEFNDAHSALRGFANSELESSVVLSAGMNPNLYSYFQCFDDFFPDEYGFLRKKVIVKVSDYRSALIQGKFFAKKGVWVSEYRIESGLNCGGHAFATNGHLMGPILEEFKNNRAALYEETFTILQNALREKGKPIPESLEMRISAQGGVGTAEEHLFLTQHYHIDSVGWGSPFLLVPEVCNVDEFTLQKLLAAKEQDLYLSNISPLGVFYNNLRGNSKEIEQQERIKNGKPCSPCYKKNLALNFDRTGNNICSGSNVFQAEKIKEINDKNLSPEQYAVEYNKIVEKACLCVGLGNSSLIVNNIDTSIEGNGVSICPGPNIAYFQKKMTLQELIDHIYGRANVINRTDRPNMFIKELYMYIDLLKKNINSLSVPKDQTQLKSIYSFCKNLIDGISYYSSFFTDRSKYFKDSNMQFEIAKANEIVNNVLKELEE